MNIAHLLSSSVLMGALALCSFTFTILTFFFGRKRKRLSYQIVRNAEIFEPAPASTHPYNITVNGHIVAGLALVILALRNTGDLPVRKSDFEEALQFRFEGDTSVLSSRVLSTVPDALPVTLTHEAAFIRIAPLLLKPRESLSLEILLSKRPERITPIERIADTILRQRGQEVETASLLYYWTAAVTWGIALFVLGVFTAGYQMAHAMHHGYSLRHTLPFVIIMFLAPVVTGILLHRRS